MAVPKVRDAVHRATAPREYALPKTRERLPAAEPLSVSTAPCPDVGYPGGGVLENDPLVASSGNPQRSGGPGNPLGPEVDPTKDIFTRPAAPIPEPHAWLQLLLGFALIGGSVRLARRPHSEEEQELLDRVDELKKDAPQ